MLCLEPKNGPTIFIYKWVIFLQPSLTHKSNLIKWRCLLFLEWHDIYLFSPNMKMEGTFRSRMLDQWVLLWWEGSLGALWAWQHNLLLTCPPPQHEKKMWKVLSYGPKTKGGGQGLRSNGREEKQSEHFAGAQGFHSHVSLRFGCLITQVLALQMNLNREMDLWTVLSGWINTCRLSSSSLASL